jgi:hypothetical protein
VEIRAQSMQDELPAAQRAITIMFGTTMPSIK